MASWNAVAERSGDTAFERKKIRWIEKNHRARESGVALRFPPQSMTRQKIHIAEFFICVNPCPSVVKIKL